ncbi:PAS domain S-box protein [Mucilaginibacter lacusdianchii]|uniref:PAS domain S-box protein n=1 Tax=Mucilaginibacter lacusdianchii TaxID=2684211 RepID=UPI00131EA0A0|nr:PAS domain S-box protein [Mucilaginibacter sp. JXJ CY 39]
MNTEEGKDHFCFDVLFYANPQPMWVFDTATLNILEVNETAVKQYGYTREEFLSKTIKDLKPQEDWPALEQLLIDIRGEHTNSREFRHKTKDGLVFHVEIISYSIVYKGINARLIHAHNISEKKEIAGKLAFTQHKLMQILETTTIGFMQIGFNWEITYWNKAAEDLIGYKRSCVLGKNFWAVLPEINHSDFHTYFGMAMHRRISTDFVDYFWPTQSWFSCYAYPVDDGIIVHFRDITGKKMAQEGLLEKIEQLKEISFLNSHAIRKPIASLLGLTNLFKEQLVSESELREVAGLIHNCSLELDEVVKEVNEKVNDDSQSMPTINLEYFSFKEFLNKIIVQAQSYSPKHKIILKKVADITFYGNKKRIEQAVKSLIINAIKFSLDANCVLVDTEIIQQNLVLTVRDYGVGMSEEQIDRIFLSLSRPDYPKTSSSSLLKVAEVCHRHHGSMWIESEINKGSTFSMRFPLSNIAMFKLTGRTDFSVYRESEADIQFHDAENYISVQWNGFHNLHSVRDVCNRICSQVEKTGCPNLLNDNTNVLGPWDDAIEWLINEWFPTMERIGLANIALVYSASTFSKLSALHTIEQVKENICIKSFKERGEALNWLLHVSHTGNKNH